MDKETNTQPYEAWLSLFDDAAAKVWYSERQELKKAAMILVVLDSEFKNVQREITNRFLSYKKKLESGDEVKFIPSSPRLRKANSLKEKENVLSQIDLMPLKNNKTDSAYRTLTPSDKSSSNDDGCISPKINKNRKLSRLKRPRNLLIAPSHSLLDIPFSAMRTPEGKFAETPNDSKHEDDDVIETTIVEVTPELDQESKKSKYSKFGDINRKRRGKTIKSTKAVTTLTQMFPTITSNTKNETVVKNDYIDITGNDSTYCNINDCNFTSIGRHDSATTTDKSESDSTLVTKNASKSSVETKPTLSDVAYKMVVRGKERMKLEGWDCDECKKFYEGVGIDPGEAKKLMNKCSRHRSKFKPDPDTIAGFWKLDFTPTQIGNENNSTVFDF